jgi:hypothetical protein
MCSVKSIRDREISKLGHAHEDIILFCHLYVIEISENPVEELVKF